MSVLRNRRGASSPTGRNGFTLVEVLVVISATALMTSIVLPYLWKAREVGWKTRCAANLQTMGVATLMYIENNFQMFPDFVYSLEDDPTAGPTLRFPLKTKSDANINYYNTDSFYCPADKDGHPIWYRDGENVDQPNYLPMSFGYNTDMFMKEIPYEGIKTPTIVTVVFDGFPYSQNNRPDQPATWVDHWAPDSEDFARNSLGIRHMDRANMLFADWHVEQRPEITKEMIYDVYYTP